MLLSLVALMIASSVVVFKEHKLGWDRYRAAGQIWGEWVLALPRAPNAIPAAWAGGDTSAVQADLYGGIADTLPVSGLGADTGLVYGIPVADEAMHFTYVDVPSIPGETCPPPAGSTYICERVAAAMLRPESRSRLDAVRRGVVDSGLSTVAIFDGTLGTLVGADGITAFETEMAGRLPASWAGFRDGDLVAVAHVSVPRNERALHHTPPPGRPDLARMRTDLDMGTQELVVEGDRVEAVGARLGNVGVTFEPSSSSTADDPEAAVRADLVVAGSLSLTAPGLARAHEVGRRDGIFVPGNEGLRITGNGTFATAETQCLLVEAGERCVTTGHVDVQSIEIDRDLTVLQEPVGSGGSGVHAGSLHATTLTITGRCNGCDNW